MVSGTIEGAMESGGEQRPVVKGVVAESLYSAKELGVDIGEAAVSSVEGVIKGVTKVGGDTGKATITAVKTALTVAKEIGDETLLQVKESLEASVDGAKNIIKEFEK